MFSEHIVAGFARRVKALRSVSGNPCLWNSRRPLASAGARDGAALAPGSTRPRGSTAPRAGTGWHLRGFV